MCIIYFYIGYDNLILLLVFVFDTTDIFDILLLDILILVHAIKFFPIYFPLLLFSIFIFIFVLLILIFPF